MKNDSEFYCERIILRKLVPEDQEIIFKLRSDPQISQFLTRDLYTSRNEAIQFIQKINEGIEKNLWYYWAIVLGTNHQMVGTICLWNFEKELARAEIGFELLTEYQGNGYAQEAIKQIIPFAFDVLQLQTILGIANQLNLASIKVLENNHFKKTGLNDAKYFLNHPKIKSMEKIKILFVCVENSNRSQMAEAFAKIHGSEIVEAISAGSKPSGIINPKAIASMKELNYDLSQHSSKSLDEISHLFYDYIITMGCGDACPYIPAKHRIDWQIPDPRNMEPSKFNDVRNFIEIQVKDLLAEIKSAQLLIS